MQPKASLKVTGTSAWERRDPVLEPAIGRVWRKPLPGFPAAHDADGAANAEPFGDNAGILRVFLVGCPRSGTTLLQSLLASHSAIHSPPETHFVDHLLRSEQHRQLPATCFPWPARVLRRWHAWRRNGEIALGWIGSTRVAKAWRGVDGAASSLHPMSTWKIHSVRAQMRRFVQVLDRDCLHAGRRLWLEKTPDHLFYVARIQRHVVGARFIHIVRNGEEVVASFQRLAQNHEAWRPYLDAMRAVQRWNCAWEETRRWIGHPDHLVVRYETLLHDPRRALTDILRFLDCQPEDAIWHRYTGAARALIRADEPWKQGNLEAIHDCRKFASTFDERQRTQILHTLEKPDWTALGRLPRVVA